MLSDIAKLLSSQIVEIQTFLNLIKTLDSRKRPTYSKEVTIAKGLFFVHLYGVLECVITSAVQKTIQIINSNKHKISDCKPIFLSIVLNSECKSLADVGRNKSWDRRCDLFERIESIDELKIDDTIFPTDGRNIGYSQLCSIWRSFNLQASVLPRMSLKGILEEIVLKRNAIAHGRESPSTVGGRYTYSELESRVKDVNELCLHIIISLEQYLTNTEYIK